MTSGGTSLRREAGLIVLAMGAVVTMGISGCAHGQKAKPTSVQSGGRAPADVPILGSAAAKTRPSASDEQRKSSTVSLAPEPGPSKPATADALSATTDASRTGAAQRSVASPSSVTRLAVPMPTERDRRAHIVFPSRETFNEFMDTWNSQKEQLTHIGLLSRFLDEINAEQRKVEEQLLTHYGIQSDRQYRYDVAQATIFEISPDRPTDPPRIHRKLATDDDRRKFAGLLSRRDSLRIQAQGVNLLLRDKRQKLEELRTELVRRYAISRDREYDFDAEARTVWERIPKPTLKEEAR